MTLSIDLVRTPAELSEFICLPRRLYESMPDYVPPLDLERRELLDPRKSPFFSHGYAAYWIARRDDRAVGRISAQIDLLAGPSTPADTGFFGCLDTIDDRDVVALLMTTAENWLRNHERHYIRGPFLLSINGESGLLIEGQSEPPITLLPWHPAYLDRHLRETGYVCAKRLFSYVLDLRKISPADLQRHVPRHLSDVTIRDMQLGHIEEEMEIGRPIFNDGWQNNWGFTPASESDVRGLARSFKHFLLPGCGFFVKIKGDAAAFALAIPNIFDISSDLGGAPSIFGWIKLIVRILKKKYRSFRLVFIGAATKYHGTGIGKAAIVEIIRRLQNYGASELACAWVLENNVALIRILESLGFRQATTYGVFEKRLVH